MAAPAAPATADVATGRGPVQDQPAPLDALARARRLGHRVGSLHLPPVPPPPEDPVQRKITYRERPKYLRGRLIRRFKEVREAGFEIPDFDDLATGIKALDDSPIDYGMVDLDDNQHVALVAYYIAKQRMRGKEEEERTVRRPDGEVESETERIEDQEEAVVREEKEWKERERGTLYPHRTYRTIYLGAGASIAYHVATRSPNLDPLDSLVIGPEQPWAGARGPGVVAHPEHMISPMRQFLGDTGDAVDDVFLDRGKFSELVAKVLEKSGIGRIKAPVESLARSETYDMVRVRVRGLDKPYYADKVVAGMGVGGHALPRGIDKGLVAGETSQVGSRRVMDMDLFTRVAGDLKKGRGGVEVREGEGDPSDVTLILSGGNGAIDVAFDALNKGYKVHWIVGRSGPKFLPGFFNLAAYLPYLRSLTKEQLARTELKDERGRDKEIQRVEDLLGPLYAAQTEGGGHAMFDGVVDRFLNPDKKFESVHFGYLDGSEVKQTDTGVSAAVPAEPSETLQADLLVYGQGQDNKTFELLAGFMDDLVPQQDVSGRFGDPGKTTIGLTTFDDKVEVVGATAFRLAPQLAVSPERLKSAEGLLWAEWEKVAAARRTLRIKPFNDVHSRLAEYASAFGTPGEADALRRFGEESERFDGYVDSLDEESLGSAERQALAGFQRAVNRARRMGKVAMERVIGTLPDNVLINDQLTPTRSQIEASTGFVPYDIGRRANFVTDDRTALRVHIAARYPRLRSYWANLMVERIVASRTEEVWGYAPDFRTEMPGVSPKERAVPPYGARFQKIWEAYLGWLEKEKPEV